MISSSCPYFRSQTTYIHTCTLCSYKISTLTSEQHVNFYCLYRNIKKLRAPAPPAPVIVYHNQPPDHLGGPALGSFQRINLLLAQGSPRLGTALQIQSHKRQTEGKDHFPGPACGCGLWLHIYSCSPGCSHPSLLPQLTHCKDCC